MMKTLIVVASLMVSSGVFAQGADKEIRIGIIGLDTSHAPDFTSILNDPKNPEHIPGARVVAAFRGGSPDVELSATRIDKFTKQMQDEMKIELVPSIEALLKKVDAVMLLSVDGRAHLAQVRPVFAAKKRVFINKPLAGSLEDARAIVRLSQKTGTPFYSSSSMRFVPEIRGAAKSATVGPVLGAFAYSPATIEPKHPDLFFYGVHGVEILYTLMGPGCVSVSRVNTPDVDTVIGRWADGRIGTFRGTRKGDHTYGAVVFGEKGVEAIGPKKFGYGGHVAEMVNFFKTGKAPVSPAETLEIINFMHAAELSKQKNGAEVRLESLVN
jgi:predicted dehydrogenase